MHDELLAVAARRARTWLVVIALLGATGPAIVAGVLTGLAGAAVTYAVVALAGIAWFLAGAPGIRRAPWPQAGVAPAGTEVTGIAEGIALATGSTPAQAWEVAHPAPNVAGFVGSDGRVLLVTEGARGLLTRDQLEAVCATQLAIGADPTCRRLLGAVAAIQVARIGGFLAVVTLGFTIPFVFPIGILALSTIPGTAAAWLLGGRVRWWSRVAVDGVCVRTTRHPEALVQALPALARWSGEQVPIGLLSRLLGAGGSQWAIELGFPWTSHTTVNGRLVDQRTSAMVDDARLLLRAGLVRRVCLEGADASVASYQEVAANIRRAGRAAATGGAAEIEGELVGLEGVVMADGVAPAGWHPDPLGRARLRWWDGASWTDRTSA